MNKFEDELDLTEEDIMDMLYETEEPHMVPDGSISQKVKKFFFNIEMRRRQKQEEKEEKKHRKDEEQSGPSF